MKMRVICVTRPLLAQEAFGFARRFENLFHPLFVWSEENGPTRKNGYHYQYFVVRVPAADEPEISGHEMNVDPREMLGVIPANSTMQPEKKLRLAHVPTVQQ